MNSIPSNSKLRSGRVAALALSGALAIALALPACGGSDDGGNSIAMYASAQSGLEVRGGPSTSTPKLGQIPFGGEVRVLAQGDRTETIAGKTGRWAKIEHAGGEAWVFGGFLTASRPQNTSNTAEESPKDPAARRVVGLGMGDVGCYLELDYGEQIEARLVEDDHCLDEYVDKHITFQTRKQSIMAASCQGDPECEDTEEHDIITSVQVQ